MLMLRESFSLRGGTYTAQRRLGSGGSARVYEVVDGDGSLFAARVIEPYMSGGSITRQERFAREMIVLEDLQAQASSPYIIWLYEHGRITVADGDVHDVAIMELCDGGSLDDYVNSQPNGVLSVADTAWVGAMVAAGMEQSGGLVHRDLKPENLMLIAGQSHPNHEVKLIVGDIAAGAKIKIIDWGLVGHRPGLPKLTAPDSCMGTPEFFSPEVAASHSGMVDCRSDIYTLGVVLWTLLEGATPYDGHKVFRDPVDAIRKSILTKDLVIKPSFGALAPVIQKCCQRRPAHRYQSWVELLADLEAVCGAKVP